MRTPCPSRPIAALLLLALAGPAAADPGTTGTASLAPRVPVSAFARPAAWLDLSRLEVSTSVSVGTGWGGRAEGLQVTRFQYQFASPLSLRLSLANVFGAGPAGRPGPFLEGLALAYRPHPAFQIQVDYRDIRSPLQYGSGLDPR